MVGSIRPRRSISFCSSSPVIKRHTHVKNKTPGTPDVILNEKGSCVRISFLPSIPSIRSIKASASRTSISSSMILTRADSFFCGSYLFGRIRERLRHFSGSPNGDVSDVSYPQRQRKHIPSVLRPLLQQWPQSSRFAKCLSTIERQMRSPKPRPFSFSDRPDSVSRESASEERTEPEFSTLSSARSCAAIRFTVMRIGAIPRRKGGVKATHAHRRALRKSASSAFLRRLRTSIRSSTGSPWIITGSEASNTAA